MMVAATGSAVATEWQTLSPPGEGFSIDFPAEPAMRDVVEMKSEAIEFFHDYRAFVDDGVFLVDVVRFTPDRKSVV